MMFFVCLFVLFCFVCFFCFCFYFVCLFFFGGGGGGNERPSVLMTGCIHRVIGENKVKNKNTLLKYVNFCCFHSKIADVQKSGRSNCDVSTFERIGHLPPFIRSDTTIPTPHTTTTLHPSSSSQKLPILGDPNADSLGWRQIKRTKTFTRPILSVLSASDSGE